MLTSHHAFGSHCLFDYWSFICINNSHLFVKALAYNSIKDIFTAAFQTPDVYTQYWYIYFFQSCQYRRRAFAVTDEDLCSDNETQLISFASQTSPPRGNWNNKQSTNTDMINGVLRLESSGIYIISMGELAIFIGMLHEQQPYDGLIALHCLKLLMSQRLADDWTDNESALCFKGDFGRTIWITIINM